MQEKNNKKYNLSFSGEQINYIIESLLYAGSINIGADWQERDHLKLIELAIKIKEKVPESVLNLENLTLYTGDGFEDSSIEIIEENFDIDLFTVKELETV